MIFLCMELFLVIFQVFHDFQSLWEPCNGIISNTHYNWEKLETRSKDDDSQLPINVVAYKPMIFLYQNVKFNIVRNKR